MNKPFLFISLTIIITIIVFLAGCDPNTKGVAEIDIEATVISLDNSFDNAGIEFKIGGMTVVALLDDLTPVQYAYVKAHKDKIQFSVDISASEGGAACCRGVHFTFYLLGKEVQTVSRVMEYEQFIKISHKIPTFRYTIIKGKKVDNLKLEGIE